MSNEFPPARSLSERFRSLAGSVFGGRDTMGGEKEVGEDPALASSRATGGGHEVLSGDRGSVTGTGDTDTFVGQIAGDDLGYAGETGAERRAEAAHEGDDPPGGTDGTSSLRPG